MGPRDNQDDIHGSIRTDNHVRSKRLGIGHWQGGRKETVKSSTTWLRAESDQYRTISQNSALILARIFPIDFRVREAAALYEVKRGISRRVVADRDVEQPTPYDTMPHPAGAELHMPGGWCTSSAIKRKQPHIHRRKQNRWKS